MYHVFKDFMGNNVRFKHRIIDRDFSNYKNFLIVDKKSDKFLFSKTTKEALSKFCLDPQHYRQLWIRNEIFYKNKVDMYNLSVLVYPNPYVDTFKFTVDHDELAIERADCNDPWHFYLRLKIVNTETSESQDRDVGLNRTLPLLTPLHLPDRVFLSSELKPMDLSFGDDIKTVVISLDRRYTKNLGDEIVLLCEDTHSSNQDIENYFQKNFDYIILFTGSDAIYHCGEKNNIRNKEIFISEVILSTILQKNNNYNIKFVFSGEEIIIPGKKNNSIFFKSSKFI